MILKAALADTSRPEAWAGDNSALCYADGLQGGERPSRRLQILAESHLPMKAWQVTVFGEPEEMTLEDVPVPSPSLGQVLIRNRAVGLNFFDILQIQGKYQSKPSFPFTVGREVAGHAEAVGEGVGKFSVGEAVLAFPDGGGYAEYSLAAADRTFPKPDEMDFPAAAGMATTYQTSYFALTRRARLQEGEWLLVHAGASGVGVAALQLGKALGARTIATAGSDEKLAFCRAQGADHAIGYADPSWVDQVKEITSGRGADVIYDPVGGDVFDLSTKCIAPDGRLLIVGFAAGRIPSIAANRVLLKNMSVVGVFWGRHVDEHPGYLAEAQQSLMDFHQQGKIRPSVSITYPLSQAPAALRDLARRKITGKAALVIE